MSQSSAPESPFLTVTQAAEYLRLQPCTLNRWRTTGEGPFFIKAGGRIYYRLADLESYTLERRRRSTAEHRAKKREAASQDRLVIGKLRELAGDGRPRHGG